MTTEKVGTYPYWMEPARCDLHGNAPLSYLFGILLEIAAHHSEDRGFGYEVMTERRRAWVLSRIGIYVHRYPRHDENVECKTWVEDVERIFTRRCFAILGADGEVLLRAQSYWAAIDMLTRRPTDIAEMDPSILQLLVTDAPYPMPVLSKLPVVECENPISYMPQYSDFDINRHFNSVKYVEHLLNLYGEELLEGKTVNSFEIVYLKEALPHDRLLLLRDGDNVEMVHKETGKSICKALVNLV